MWFSILRICSCVRVIPRSSTFAQKHVRGAFTGDGLLAFVAERSQIDAAQKMFSGPEQDRPDGEMQFVDQAAARYCRIVATPPPTRTSRPPAAALACSSAASMPSVTKRNSVPPAIVSGGRAWCVSTKTGV